MSWETEACDGRIGLGLEVFDFLYVFVSLRIDWVLDGILYVLEAWLCRHRRDALSFLGLLGKKQLDQ